MPAEALQFHQSSNRARPLMLRIQNRSAFQGDQKGVARPDGYTSADRSLVKFIIPDEQYYAGPGKMAKPRYTFGHIRKYLSYPILFPFSDAGKYVVTLGVAIVPVLVKALGDKDATVRHNAVIALGRIGASANSSTASLIAGFLMKSLKDTSSHVRNYAADALGRIGPSAKVAVSALIVALGDRKVGGVRWHAIHALGSIGPSAKASVSALAEIVRNDAVHRKYAAESLGNIGSGAAAAVPSLISMLKTSKDREERETVIGTLGKIGPAARSAISELIRAFKMGLREKAAVALGRIGPAAKPAFSMLLRALNDEEDDVRRAAGRALGLIDPNTTLNVSLRKLRSRKAATRAHAIMTLGLMGKKAKVAIGRIMAALKDRDEDVRREAVESLWKIGGQSKPVALALARVLMDKKFKVSEVAFDIFLENPKGLIPIVASQLKLRNAAKRHVATEALRKICYSTTVGVAHCGLYGGCDANSYEVNPCKDANVVSSLVGALKLYDWRERWKITEVLGHIRDRKAVPALIRVLSKDRNAVVRVGAAESLGKIGDARAIPPLVTALRDRASVVRLTAAESLADIGKTPAGKGLVSLILPHMNNRQMSWRRGAALVLGMVCSANRTDPNPPLQCKNGVVANKLISSLKDSDWRVREEAAGALGDVMNRKAVVPLVVLLLKDANWQVRSKSAEALGYLHDKKAVPFLEAALARDSRRKVRLEAAAALCRIKYGQDTWSDRIEATSFLKALKDVDWRLREAAVWKLGENSYGNVHVVPALKTALSDKNRRVRKTALTTLKKIRSR